MDRMYSLPELEAEITELSGHLNAAEYRWLTLVGEFDRRNGWMDGAGAAELLQGPRSDAYRSA